MPVRPSAIVALAAIVTVAAHAQVDPRCGNTMVMHHLLDLLPPGQETRRAVVSGNWSHPATWGGIGATDLPGPGDDVYIPPGVTVTYDVFDDGDRVGPDTTRVHFIRVDGTMTWATDRDTRLYVDTLLSNPTGHIEVGTDAEPIAAGVRAEIVIIADDAMDVSGIDVRQVGRGIVPHGPTRMVGSDKTDFGVLLRDARAGEPAIMLTEAPTGWSVGDTLVLAGTFFDPDGDNADNSRFHDEVLRVTAIDGATVTFTNTAPGSLGLRWDHARPSGTHFDAGDLSIHVANLTRNITVRSELDDASPDTPGPGDSQDLRRGHVMVMHTPDVVIRNTAFVGFGRLNKNEFIDDPIVNVDGSPATGTNTRGRYAFHLHRNLPRGNQPVDFTRCRPAEVTGCVVWDSPGWGFVHHDSYAIFEDNVAFDVLGAAFVQEAGNEIGLWRNNISIKSTGDADEEMTVEPFGDGAKRVANFDFGFNGEAYWVQGASQVEFIDNVGASAAGGGIQIFSQVDGLGGQRDVWAVPREHLRPAVQHIVTRGDGLIDVSHTPMQRFSGFEVYNSDFGLITWGHMRNQGEWIGFTCPCDNIAHRERSRVDNFRFWNIYGQGIHLQYTSQLDLVDGIVASVDLATPGVDDKPALDLGINGEGRGFGIGMNGPTKRLHLESVAVEGWLFGVRTPLEGQINELDRGEGTGSEGATGLPTRRSRFIDLKLANNTNHLFRRQNGFTETQPLPNWLVIEGGNFSVDADNVPPEAIITYESIGPHGVVRLNGIESRDYDTPGEGLPARDPRAAVVDDDNYIAAYAWDLDGDGRADAFGQTVVVRLPLGEPSRIGLTVWDHQGATTSASLDVTPRPSAYDELLVDGGFDDADAQGQFEGGLYALTSAEASTGWFDARAQVIDGRAYLTGQYSFSSVGQAVYDERQRRGEHTLSFDLEIAEGHADPSPSEASRVTVRVFGINGEFGSQHREASPEPYSAIPVEIDLLFEETILGVFPPTGITRTFDVGPEGYEYLYVGFQGEGLVDSISGDFATVDNVSIKGACAADLDRDGELTIFDFLSFQNLFDADDPAADFDGDGSLTLFDFLAFQNAFDAGC